MSKVNLNEKFGRLKEFWKPAIVGELNGQQVKLVKMKGEFVMHHHDAEDEFFLVIKGHLKMDYGHAGEEIGEGEFVIIPRGVEHRPMVDQETWVLLFEPASTLNTGNLRNELTHDSPERM